MIFQHHRFQIWNANQHPFKHSPDEFLYSHPALPDNVNTMGGTLDYIIAVLYPQSKPAVATPAALPLVGNSINDMRVVQDDGDGNAASYRWEQREGDASPQWYKIYDVDWGTDSILQGWELKTQDTYVFKYGYDDNDVNGDPIVGDMAGQSIYGGSSANTNLTLFANSGDGVGPATGYIQFGDQVRPLADNSVDLGTTLRRFKKVWSYAYQAGTLVIADGSITDTDGTISFGSTNLTTSGSVTVGNTTFSSSSVDDTSGSLSFNALDLTTTGDFTSNKVTATGAASVFKTGTTIGNLTLADGSITDSDGSISFGSNNLSTSGNISTSAGYVQGISLKTATLDITGNVITATGSDLTVDAGANDISFLSNLLATSATFSDHVTIGDTKQLKIADIRLDTNGLSSVASNIKILPFSGNIFTTSIKPDITSTYSLGDATFLWTDISFSGNLNNATQTLTNATLFSLRDINVGVASGMSLFWDGSKWVASAPDTEITHNTVSGLTTGDAGHTQFVMLAGRAGGQAIQGGDAASENLTLESTSHATKGYIYFKDTMLPFTDASYSGGWSGIDIGSPSKRLRHVYGVGEYFGLRLENLGASPGSSSQNVGRVYYDTSTKRVYVDTGTSIEMVGDSMRYEEDTVWDGVQLTYNVTVTTLNMDARKAIWQLKDNTNSFETIYAKITSSSATVVTIAVNTPLPAGTYRLVGVQ